MNKYEVLQALVEGAILIDLRGCRFRYNKNTGRIPYLEPDEHNWSLAEELSLGDAFIDDGSVDYGQCTLDWSEVTQELVSQFLNDSDT